MNQSSMLPPASEANPTHSGQHLAEWPAELVVFAADNRELLLARIQQVAQWAESAPADSLPEAAAAWNRTLPSGGERLAIVAKNPQHLAELLARAAKKLADPKCQRIKDNAGIYYFAEPMGLAGRVAWLYPGEGTQSVGMIRELDDSFPTIRESLDWCDQVAANADVPLESVTRFTRFPTDATEAERAAAEKDLRRFDNAMFSVLMADLALARLLGDFQVPCHATAGHSAGEIAALVSTGAMMGEGTIGQVVAIMHWLEEDHGDQGAVLLAIGASRADVEAVLTQAAAESPEPLEARLAMDNCPHQCIVVGLPDSVRRVEAIVASKKLMFERLVLARPYHTEFFQPFMGPLRTLFEVSEFHVPAVPTYSCVTGGRFPDDPAAARELVLAHWVSRVEFTKLLRTMHDDGVRVFVEVGPRGMLSSFVEDSLRGRPATAIPLDVPHRGGRLQLLHALAQLAAHHVPVRLSFLEEVRRPQVQRPAPAMQLHEATEVPAGAASVMHEYWRVMGQFLDTQQVLMGQHLASRGQPRRGRAVRRPTRPTVAAPVREPAATLAPATTNPSVAGAATEPATRPTPETLPLIGTVVRHEPGREILVRRRLDLAEERYADHHTVGGQHVSKVHPEQHGLPVGPMTFTLETMAEAAILLVPDRVVTALKDIKLFKWLAFDPEEPDTVEFTGRIKPPNPKSPEAPDAVEVEMRVELVDSRGGDQARRAVAASGTVVLQPKYPPPTLAGDFPLTNEHPCPITVPHVYGDLFHGPMFQGILGMGRSGDHGVEAEVEVLPREGLFASTPDPQFVADPVLMDVLMHPLSAWHLEQPNRAGRTLLPFEVQRVELFGPRPRVGERMLARLSTDKETTRQFVHSVEGVRPDGTLWCRMRQVKYWRFYMPFGDINFHSRKDEYFLSQQWPDARPQTDRGDVFCIRVTPPPDLLQPAMQLVAGYIALGPGEMERFRQSKWEGQDRLNWLFIQMSGKDAARLAWHNRHRVRLFPADIEIQADQHGRQYALCLDAEPGAELPHVSMDELDGFYAGLAAFSPYVGLALQAVGPVEGLSHEELALASGQDDRDEAAARLMAAKRAVAKALGAEGSAADCWVEDLDPSGDVTVSLGETLGRLTPELAGCYLHVKTLRDGAVVVGTTLCRAL